MQLSDKTYNELNSIFKFDMNPIEKYKTVENAEKHIDDWGESNLLIPKSDLSDWFRLAVEALKKKKRVVLLNTFNPHYKYWFKYVWTYAAKVLMYTKHVITFKGYDNPCPKTIAVILFDPDQRTTPRKDIYSSYVDGKYEYFTLPLKVKKSDVEKNE